MSRTIVFHVHQRGASSHQVASPFRIDWRVVKSTHGIVQGCAFSFQNTSGAPLRSCQSCYGNMCEALSSNSCRGIATPTLSGQSADSAIGWNQTLLRWQNEEEVLFPDGTTFEIVEEYDCGDCNYNLESSKLPGLRALRLGSHSLSQNVFFLCCPAFCPSHPIPPLTTPHLLAAKAAHVGFCDLVAAKEKRNLWNGAEAGGPAEMAASCWKGLHNQRTSFKRIATELQESCQYRC